MEADKDKERTCKYCFKMFINCHKMKAHEKLVHNKEGLKSCGECGKMYTNQTSLKYHKYSKHQEKPSCDQCKEEFLNYSNYIEHRRLKHRGNVQTKKSDYKECQECKRQILSKNMARHIKEYHAMVRTNLKLAPEEETLVYKECDICGKGFKRMYMLANHKRSVHGGDPIKCDRCDKNYLRRSELNRHIKEVHLEGEAHYCPKCKKTFHRNSNMNRHYGRCKPAAVEV